MSFSRLKLLVLSLRDLIPATTPVVLIALTLIIGAFWLLDPTPPKRLVLATGAEQSAYEVLGRRYREALAPFGIEVELRSSAGSAENLASLQSASSGVDVAFVQGGTYRRPPGENTEDDIGLVSLGSLFYEPVWLFYREDSARRLLKKPRLEAITELKGWRMNAGAPGSGVKVLAEELLELNGLATQDMLLSHLANTPAVVELLEARTDAMLFVSAQPGAHIDPNALAAFVQDNILEPPARPRVVSVIPEMPVTPVGKIFKPKLREIAAGEAARELLAQEGLSGEVSVDAITDPSRGLYLSVSAPPDKAEKAERLLKKFPVKVELRP